jgi:hypothetical protein
MRGGEGRRGERRGREGKGGEGRGGGKKTSTESHVRSGKEHLFTCSELERGHRDQMALLLFKQTEIILSQPDLHS